MARAAAVSVKTLVIRREGVEGWVLLDNVGHRLTIGNHGVIAPFRDDCITEALLRIKSGKFTGYVG